MFAVCNNCFSVLDLREQPRFVLEIPNSISATNKKSARGRENCNKSFDTELVYKDTPNKGSRAITNQPEDLYRPGA